MAVLKIYVCSKHILIFKYLLEYYGNVVFTIPFFEFCNILCSFINIGSYSLINHFVFTLSLIIYLGPSSEIRLTKHKMYVPD